MNHSTKTMKKAKIPAHLKQYVIEQNYDQYTAIDQAVWRYVMRQNTNFLDERAHNAYIDGLKASGINIESIPKVEEMNKCLAPYGWGAVTIDGFIPGVAFFDFQAHGILPIATDIRTLEHIDYTPAPDIIHEAAGHAPILCNEKYAQYVKIFGDIGAKAIATKEEHAVFEAIKRLSSMMEDGTSTKEEIKEAKATLDKKLDSVTEISEAAQVSRLYWWTVEYGLIGDVERPLIYGAGLLSSVGESMNCLTDQVKKLPFEVKACIETDYDVTKPQPQLFVCESFDQLIAAVQEFSKTMAFSIGGTVSLDKALKSGSTATSVYRSGLQVSGTFTHIEKDSSGEAIYMKTTGPTALAVNNIELPGHDKSYHDHGFSSPIGLLETTSTPLEEWSDQELNDHGIVNGKHTELVFKSGVNVRGKVIHIHREHGRIVLISIEDCTVEYGDQVLFQPEWGTYDMAVGATISSVYAGAADRECFFAEDVQEEVHGSESSGTIEDNELIKPNNDTEGSESTKELALLEDLYQTVRKAREEKVSGESLITLILEVDRELDRYFSNDWLLRLELLEIIMEHNILQELSITLKDQLKQLKAEKPNLEKLIDNGLKLL
jgi:phenylalanine-4-hydroxylase